MVPPQNGQPRRFGELVVCGYAAWGPNGRRIGYTDDHSLFVVNSDGTEPKRLVTVVGTPRVSDGTVDEVFDLTDYPTQVFPWSGLSLDGSPIILRNFKAAEVYTPGARKTLKYAWSPTCKRGRSRIKDRELPQLARPREHDQIFLNGEPSWARQLALDTAITRDRAPPGQKRHVARSARRGPTDVTSHCSFTQQSMIQHSSIKAYRSVLGLAPRLAGGYAGGIITRNHLGYDGYQCGVAVVSSDTVKADLFIEHGLRERGEREVGHSLGAQIRERRYQENAGLIYMYDSVKRFSAVGGFDMNVATYLVEGMEQTMGTWLPAAGMGMIGNIQFNPTFQFFDDQVCQQAAMALVLHGDRLRLDTTIMHGCKPASGYHTVTRADRNVVLEIDHRPALDVIAEILGPDSGSRVGGLPHLRYVGGQQRRQVWRVQRGSLRQSPVHGDRPGATRARDVRARSDSGHGSPVDAAVHRFSVHSLAGPAPVPESGEPHAVSGDLHRLHGAGGILLRV